MSDFDGIFILNSLYDPANLAICFGFTCNPYSTCSPTQLAAMTAYHWDLQTNITAGQFLYKSRDGYFLTSCFQHEESCRARDWYNINIGGSTPNSTFYRWYTIGASVETALIDAEWPADSSCAMQGVDHGAC